MLELSELWFILVTVLFVGFVFLEGFDFGVGMGTRFLAKNELERRVLINAIGPHWDANEVWLLTAGGAMFAAFPHWYATLFSGYYLPFVVLLLALIARGVAFEYRSKTPSKKWRATWDWSIFLGSLLPPFLLGVLFSSLIKGLPVNENMEMNAGFFDIVNLYTIVCGVAFVMLAFMHGLIFLTLKTEGEIRERANQMALKMYISTGIVIVLFVILTFIFTDVIENRGAVLIPMYIVAVVLYLLLYNFLKKKKEGWSFAMTGLMIVIVVSSFFVGLFPNVLISSIDPAYNITVYTAASGDYSLKVMTIVAGIFVPIVLLYTIWSYYVFRKRISSKSHLEY